MVLFTNPWIGIIAILVFFSLGLYKDKLLTWLAEKENSPNVCHCEPQSGEAITFLRLLRSLRSLAMTAFRGFLKSALNITPPIYKIKIGKYILVKTKAVSNEQNNFGPNTVGAAQAKVDLNIGN